MAAASEAGGGASTSVGQEASAAGLSSGLTEDPRPSLTARAMLAVIALYRATAVLRAPRCRFAPSCSNYAAESVATHGALRGGRDAMARILRCHPWNPGGYDPVKPRT